MLYCIFLDNKETSKEVFERTSDINYSQEVPWIETKNFNEFTKLIATNVLEGNGMPDIISIPFNLGFDILDKSLNNKALSGVDVLQYLIQLCIERNVNLPKILIHSGEPNQVYSLKTLAKNSKSVYGI